MRWSTLGSKTRNFKQHESISLEDLVPEDNFYRHVEQIIDLGLVHDLAGEFYSSIGRQSIDPVFFFKLQLIAFFEGIQSERQLRDRVILNLAHRWYIGYDLGEVIPDYSSLSKIRERYGLEVFHRFFEHIIELCIQARLVWGTELYFDSTKVQANTDIDAVVVIALSPERVKSRLILQGYTKIVSQDLKDYNVENLRREIHAYKTNVVDRPIIN